MILISCASRKESAVERQLNSLKSPLLEKQNALPMYGTPNSLVLKAPTPTTNSSRSVASSFQGTPPAFARMAAAILM